VKIIVCGLLPPQQRLIEARALPGGVEVEFLDSQAPPSRWSQARADVFVLTRFLSHTKAHVLPRESRRVQCRGGLSSIKQAIDRVARERK
jgi:hypothetical protein